MKDYYGGDLYGSLGYYPYLTNEAAQLLFLFNFSITLLSYYPSLLFLLFLCFTRPYITFLRCLDVKPYSLTH